MKLNLIFFIGVTLIFSTSCLDSVDNYSPNYQSDIKTKILKERDPNQPWVSSKYLLKTTRSFQEKGFEDFIGCSVTNVAYPIEDLRNLGYPVIDIKKLSMDNPNYFTKWKVNTGEAYSFTYDSEESYTSNSTITKKVNNGFNLDLGLFSIGNKKILTETFSTNIVENQNSVFGELDIVIRDSAFRMKYTSSIKMEILNDYLHEEFKKDLYNLHPTEFFQNYGGFVLGNFITGGKATALYAGIYKKAENTTTKLSDLSREISASYGFKSDQTNNSVSGNLNLGNVNNNTTSITNEFNSIKMSIKTAGGNSSFASFSIPKEIKDTNINLSEWLSSLNENKTLIEFGYNGLIPITDFIIEENLKETMMEYYKTGNIEIRELQEPYISIDVSIPDLSVCTILHTKYGDNIVLNIQYDTKEHPYYEQLLEEKERIGQMFGMKIISSPFEYDPRIKYLYFKPFEESHLYKYIYNNTIYIVSDYIDNNPESIYYNKRYAFSVQTSKTIQDYAMKDLIERLPSINLDFAEFIRKYTIYAL